MALCRRLCFSGKSMISNLNISTSCSVNNKWRIQQGLEKDPRAFGPLTNYPDYSFVDGRPTILSNRKLRKLQYQEDICKKIVQFSNEIDESLEQYHEREKQKIKTKEAILRSKLKEKGAKLLPKNKRHSNTETQSSN